MRYFFIILLLTSNIYASKLDLTSNVGASLKTYQNLINKNEQNSLSYYTENADINFKVKKITLEKAEDSYMDVSIGITGFFIDNSSKIINSIYFTEPQNIYPSINTTFINNAYIKIYNFYKENIDATFGRQNFILGQGLTLSDNKRGFTGVKFDLNNYFKLDKTEIFLFRDVQNEKIYKILGTNFYKFGVDGIWQAYYFMQKSAQDTQNLSYSSKDNNKSFTGLRYALDKNKIYFDGEIVLERGNSTNSSNNNKINYNAYAFSLKGEFNQKLPLFGKVKTKISYSRSSGNSSNVNKEDKSFYAEFANKYNGFERLGQGAIISASSYDIFKTSPTLNGLPDGISGLNTINIGFTFPWKKLLISTDYFIFKASENILKTDSLKIGTEWDIKTEYKLGERLDLNLIYAIFNPQSALTENITSSKSIKLTSINISAKF